MRVPKARPPTTLLCSTLLAALASCGDGGASPHADAGTADANTARNDDAGLRTVPVPSNDDGAPDMLDVTFYSDALGRDAHVRLLLPEHFAAEPERAWPVLYLLHGANEPLGYRAWTEQTHVESLAQGRDLIIAMPEAGLAGWYSDWSEDCASAAEGADQRPAWETFHLTELPALLRTEFRANDAQSIAGLSMGGFGALSYAGRHPGMFRAVASYSGALHTGASPEIVQLSLSLAGCTNTDAVWGAPAQFPAVWAAHDPYALAEQLRDVPLYVSCGDGSVGSLDPASAGADLLETLALTVNEELVARMEELGGNGLVSHLYGAGTHSWPYWDRELALSFDLLTEPLLAP